MIYQKPKNSMLAVAGYLVLTVALIVPGSADGEPGGPAAGVHRANIPDPPGHVFSGAIGRTEEGAIHFFLISAPDGLLTEYRMATDRPNMERVRMVRRGEVGFDSDDQSAAGPTQITRHGSTYTLGNPLGRMSQVRVGREVEVLGESVLLPVDGSSSRPQMRSFWAWTTDGSTVLGFGDILRPGVDNKPDHWSSAFFEVAFDDRGHYRILREVALNNPIRNYYLYVGDYFTTSGYYQYYLDMERPPSLYRSSPSGDHELFAVFGGSLESPAILPGGRGAEGEQRLHEDLHSSSYPVGIYPFPGSDDSDLLVLTHHADDSAATWQITYVDVSARETTHYALDSDADHVFLMTAESHVVAIELVDHRGSRGGLDQKPRSAIVIPMESLPDLEIEQDSWSLDLQ